MDVLKVLDRLCNILPSRVKEDIVFKTVVDKLYEMVGSLNNIIIYVRADLIDKDADIISCPQVQGVDIDNPVLFSLLSKNCEFSIEGNGIFLVTFTTTETEEELKRDKINEITINADDTLWKLVSILSGKDNYYYEYNADLFIFNKNGELLEDDDPFERERREEFLDDDFAGTFGIPIEEARECRLDFDGHRDYVNEMKAITYMSGYDEVEGNKFLSPFCMDELAGIFGVDEFQNEESADDYEDSADSEDDYDESDDSEEEDYTEIDDEAFIQLSSVIMELKRFLGSDGLFTMSLNMFYNVGEYIMGTICTLDTKGLFIRRLNGEFTAFYVNLTSGHVLVIPKKLSSEEALKFYNADDYNKTVLDLDDFFGVAKQFRIEPNEKK